MAGLIQTITGVAEGYLGDVGEWRKVLANNPSELFGKLPPSLQVDVDRYYKTIKNVTGQLNIKGLDKPSEKDVNLTVNKLFGDRFIKATDPVEAAKPDIKKVTDVLKQIDWLL